MRIAGHLAGLGNAVGLNGRAHLNALAELYELICRVQIYSLYDIGALLVVSRRHVGEARKLEHSRRKGHRLERRCRRRGRHKEALEEGCELIEVRAQRLAYAGSREALCDVLDYIVLTDAVAAADGKACTEILHHRADEHVSANVGGLAVLGELAVAVVYHNHRLGKSSLNKCDSLGELVDGEASSLRVAAAALDSNDLNAASLKACFDCIEIEIVADKVDLLVFYAVLNERVSALACRSDNALESIVGLA